MSKHERITGGDERTMESLCGRLGPSLVGELLFREAVRRMPRVLTGPDGTRDPWYRLASRLACYAEEGGAVCG